MKRIFAFACFALLTWACCGDAAAAAVPAATVADPGAALRLSRAAFERARGDVRAVIAQLEPLDWSAPRFAGAGRAALLLAEAYRRCGEEPRLAALAAQVAAWPVRDGFAELVPAVAAGRPAAAEPGLTALARAAERLAADDVAAADAALAAVPATDRWSPRARHTRALIALERGDAAAAVALLEPLAADARYGGRREARRALAALALERHDWQAASREAAAAEADWNAQRAALAAGDTEALWRAWESAPDTAAVRLVDEANLLRAAEQAARAAANLATGQPTAWTGASAGDRTVTPAPAEAPTPAEWREASAARDAARAARADARRAWAAAAAESLALADLRRYLGEGRAALARSDARLGPAAARLDSLRAVLAALEARLRALRDDARARVAARAAALAAQADALALWGAAMQRLHVAGPDSAYWAAAPAGATSATAALTAERALAARVRASADSIAARTPRVLDRSLEDAWRPALAARITAQASEGARDRAWAAALGRSLDSAWVAAASSPAWDAARRSALLADQRAVVAEGRERDVRARIARDASARTQVALEREREGLDYLRATSAYALAVKLDVADTTQAAAGASRPGADDTDTGDPALRAEALPLLRAFVTRHPESPARAEMRFRLADLELLEARRTFRARMSEFLRAQEAGGRVPPVPVLEPGAALALYRAMLAEDATFPHLDAVRFNTAMILAESGSPESAEHFRALLERWPGSPYAQEAALRLGDLAFADRRWSDAAPLFDRAAAGADPTLATIALYKRGWAAYNEDRFAEAARAFAGVLDQYETRGAAVHVDVASEAETYFVIALAASGGADAWTRHFAASGPRAYRHRTLLALGAQLRRNGDLAGAAAADGLLIEREPLHADALFAAERRVETLRRAGDPAALEAAQAALATRFADGGAWAGAQESDSLRAAGERFTTGVAGALARTRHERARRTNALADWQLALAADEAAAARAVNEPERAARRLDVARARLALGDRAGAVRECERVASNAPDTLAREALALAVMTTDAWYESARAGAARGPDSLAAAVTRAGDRLLERFPADPLRADVRWRQAQLALAHGDDARALAALDALLVRDGADVRAPRAAMQRGEASARLGRWDEADSAFARATRLARGAKQEPLARQAFAAQQACVFRAAESEVARDSNAFARHARAFEKAAARWPAHEDADAARYRAALAWDRAGEPRDAARVLTAFTADRPRAELARDAWLLLARQHEALRDSAAAARAFLACAALERDDVQASAARLRAADDFEAAGQVARADSLRREHVRRHPGDIETAMAVYERLAMRELDAVSEARPVSALIVSGASRGAAAAPRSALAEYLRLAKLRPALVSPALVGRLRWLQGEDARLAAARVTLAAPLAKPLAARRALLDSAVVRYRRAMDAGSPVWAHAAAWRIGETLQDFASALAASAAPADLEGDDLEEYRGVLAEKARPFAARGLDVWAELARSGDAGQAPDAWVVRAREQVERHLAERFRFRPEPVFPAVEGGVPLTSREGVSR